MPYKHPTDRLAHRQHYYRQHQREIQDAAMEWYENHKGESEYKLKKRDYMVIWRRRKKEGR